MEFVLQIFRDWEWILLIAVTIVEIIILTKIITEKREREKLIFEMQVTRIELGRESYLTMIKDTLSKSSKYVYFVSHTLTSTMTETQKESIYNLYNPNVDHRCIAAKDPGKLKYMWEQKRKGVQVRVNDLLMISTFRFQVCDDKLGVLGFSDEGNEESRKGILITNAYFCRVLKQHFLKLWEESVPFIDYVKTVIEKTSGSEIASSLEEFAIGWALTEDEKRELAQFCQTPLGKS